MSAVAGKKRKVKASDEEAPTKNEPANQDKGPKQKKPKKPLDSRFGGRTEEEIMELLLPDHLKPNLDIVFVRIVTTHLLPHVYFSDRY